MLPHDKMYIKLEKISFETGFKKVFFFSKKKFKFCLLIFSFLLISTLEDFNKLNFTLAAFVKVYVKKNGKLSQTISGASSTSFKNNHFLISTIFCCFIIFPEHFFQYPMKKKVEKSITCFNATAKMH